MRVEDWFALAVRVFGVVIVMYGLGLLLDSFLFKLGYFNYHDSSPGYYMIFGLAEVLAGLYLARGAPHLLEFAYSPEDEDEDSEKVNSD